MTGGRVTAHGRFARGLERLITDPSSFLCSVDGAVFLNDVRAHIAPFFCSTMSPWGTAFTDIDELTGMVLDVLVAKPARARTILDEGDDLFKYTFTAIWNEDIYPLIGRGLYKVRKGEKTVTRHADSPGELDVSLPDSGIGRDPAVIVEERMMLSGKDRAVALTVTTLAPRSPAILGEVLPDLVSWFSDDDFDAAGERRAENLQRAASHFPGLNTNQLSAVEAMTWGARPRRADTSLLGAYLRDPEFLPLLSTTHLRALRAYRKKVAA